MSPTERMFRLVVAVVLLAGVLSIQAAKAGVMYTWDGADEAFWETATNWQVGDPPADPANPPGSNVNGSGGTVLDDDVAIPTSIGSLDVHLSAAGLDVGTVGSLHIGGGNSNVELYVDQPGDHLTIAGDLTLGGIDPADGTTTRWGGILVANDATVTVNGNILSGQVVDNDVTISHDSGVLTLVGDIDPDGSPYQFNTDLNIQRGTLTLSGAGAQTLNVDELNLANLSGNVAAVGTFTLGDQKTLVGSGTADVGRSGTAAGTNDSTNWKEGTFNIYGGSATFLGDIRIGHVNSDPTSTRDHRARGTINVGDATHAGTLTVDGQLRMAPIQPQANSGQQWSEAYLNVNNAASVVTLNGGLEMASNGQDGEGTADATVTINDGLVTVYGPIEYMTAVRNTSTINLSGGTLHLATHAAGETRQVDAFTMEDGAVLKMTAFADMAPLTAAAMDLDASAGAGNATLDIVPPSDDIVTDVTTVVEWDGGTGTWDATAANWDPDRLPSRAVGPVVPNGTTLTFLQTGGAAIADQANIVLDASDADWTLDLSDASMVQATYGGAGAGYGAGKAALRDAADVVTRTTDLLIANQPGLGADAAALDIAGGASLTLDTGTPDLIIDGNSEAERILDQEVLVGPGSTLDIQGDLVFGGAPGTLGGTFRMTGGTVTVAGNIVRGLQDGTYDSSVGAAQFLVDGDLDGVYGADQGDLAFGGEMNIRSFRLGLNDGTSASYTLPTGKTLASNGYIRVAFGLGAMATLTNDGGTLSGTRLELAKGDGASADFVQNDGSTTIAGAVEIGSGPNSVGSFVKDAGATDVSGTMTVGLGTGAVGTFVQNGGDTSVAGLLIGTGGGAGNVFTLIDGTFSTAGGLTNANSQLPAYQVVGTVTIGDPADPSKQPVLTVSGDNFECAEIGNGVVNIHGGSIYLETNNFVVSSSNGTTEATCTMTGGTLDLRGTLGDRTDGDLNFNDGDGDMTITGGTVFVSRNLQMSNTSIPPSVSVLTLDGGTVYVRQDLKFRDGGIDQVYLWSGSLIFGNEHGLFAGGLTGDNVIDTAGNPVTFDWAGGTLSGLERIDWILYQGNSRADSLLEIGASPGTMSVQGHYTLAHAGSYKSVLEIEIFGDGTGGPGVDFDKLIVAGDANLDASSDIALVLQGYTPVLNDQWDILDAANIIVTGSVEDLFDTTSAGLGAGLTWDFSDFTTDGTVKVVPEPATLALLGLGAAASLLLRRRRRA